MTLRPTFVSPWYFLHLILTLHYLSDNSFFLTIIESCLMGECSEVPMVSKMPTPLKTYSKLQIRIFVVTLYVATSWENSVQLRFENRNIIVIN